MGAEQGNGTAEPSQEIFGPNAWLVEEMFDRYRSDPASVSESWRVSASS